MKSISLHLILFITGVVLATDTILGIKTAESVGLAIGHAVMGLGLLVTTIIFGYVHDKQHPLYVNSTNADKDSLIIKSNIYDFLFFFILEIGNKIAISTDSTLKTEGIIAGMLFVVIPIKISIERNIEKQLKGDTDGNSKTDNNTSTNPDTGI